MSTSNRLIAAATEGALAARSLVAVIVSAMITEVSKMIAAARQLQGFDVNKEMIRIAYSVSIFSSIRRILPQQQLI